MEATFVEPTAPLPSRSVVFAAYLDYFRSRLLETFERFDGPGRRRSRLPSGWTPAELVKHLTFVELRWLEWGFQGREVAEPWGDQEGDRWYVAPTERDDQLVVALRERGERTRALIEGTALDAVGRPGPRWDGAEPPTLERILFHLVQEYARHLGHLDVVAELAGSGVGE
jgi:uncharacterized damage-inducible protein DinB